MFFLKRAAPVAGAAFAAYACSDDGFAFRRRIQAFVHDSSRSFGFNDADVFPRQKWDHNWDHRDPKSLIESKEYDKATDEQKKEMLEKMKPTATRTIILVRHGQYHMDSKEKCLTELGREQANLIGDRLARSGLKFSKLTMSTMTRATETANIILSKLNDVSHKSDSILEEGAPYPPEPPVSHWKPYKNEFFEEGSRIEAAFRKYIHRASPQQKEDSTEIIVCHANVIRYFVCRALQFPPEGWLRMSLGNCSITILLVRPNGRVAVRSLGDVGHLPQDKISFS